MCSVNYLSRFYYYHFQNITDLWLNQWFFVQTISDEGAKKKNTWNIDDISWFIK